MVKAFFVCALLAGCIGMFSGDEKAMDMCQERHSYDVCFDMIYN